MSKIVVVGSANADLVTRSDRLPKPGETVMGHSFVVTPGGKGANQAVAIARLGGDVTFVGCVGADAFGDLLRRNMASERVDCSRLALLEGVETGCAAISVDANGQNTIIVVPGANARLTPQDVAQAFDAMVGDVSAVLVQLEVPMDAVAEALRQGRLRGAVTILNPAPAHDLDRELLRLADWLIPNESEAALLAGSSLNAMELAHRMRHNGSRNVVITLGGDGCYVCSPALESHFTAVPVVAVDTVAAGDAFCGAFAWAIGSGSDVADAVAIANHVAALAVTKRGAQESMPSRQELLAFAPELVLPEDPNS